MKEIDNWQRDGGIEDKRIVWKNKSDHPMYQVAIRKSPETELTKELYSVWLEGGNKDIRIGLKPNKDEAKKIAREWMEKHKKAPSLRTLEAEIHNFKNKDKEKIDEEVL